MLHRCRFPSTSKKGGFRLNTGSTVPVAAAVAAAVALVSVMVLQRPLVAVLEAEVAGAGAMVAIPRCPATAEVAVALEEVAAVRVV